MSETLQAAQNEDPLPIRPRALLGVTEYGTLDFDHDHPHTVGELVVTDERDPFRWLATQINVLAPMTENGKHVLWGLYRANGNVPANPGDVKWRDEVLALEDTVPVASNNDWTYIHKYQQYLHELDERDKKLRASKHAGEPERHLNEPDREFVAMIVKSYVSHMRNEVYARKTVD